MHVRKKRDFKHWKFAFVAASLLLLALAFDMAVAQRDDLSAIFQAQEITAHINVSSVVEVIRLGPEARMSKITIDQTFYPKTAWNQNVLGITTSPLATFNSTALTYIWQDPQAELPFHVSATVKIRNGHVPVDKKIRFPLLNLPADIEQYVGPQNTIDSNSREIIDKASELASGEDDLYVVVFKIADWVQNNVDYSLDTLTADVSQKASWVLKNKEGVCDEITSLFIAMLRSLGIPARYISGVSYTNHNNLNDFGPHAWAEVYFPGHGWVPFDITYGEMGFVDAGHIKLKETLDSDDATINYRWEGYLSDLRTQRLNIKTDVIAIEGKIDPAIRLDVKPLKSSAKFGSYNLIEAEITNLEGYYQPVELYISRSSGLEIIGSIKKYTLLLPFEKKKVYWVIRIDNSLDTGYIYTFRLLVQGTRDASDEVTFTSSANDQFYGLDYVQNLFMQRTEEREKVYSRNVSLNCTTDRTHYYIDEIVKARCDIRNLGNTKIDDIDICYISDCKSVGLGITEASTAFYAFNFSDSGPIGLDFVAKNRHISKSSTVEITMLDKPLLEAVQIESPGTVQFGKTYTIEFTLARQSFSEPIDVNVHLKTPLGTKEWPIANLRDDRKFYVTFDSGMLDEGKNEFVLTADYADLRGRKYAYTKAFEIHLEELNFWQKIQSMFNRAIRNFSSTDAKILILIAFTFGLLIGMIFRKYRGRKEHEEEIKAEGKMDSRPVVPVPPSIKRDIEDAQDNEMKFGDKSLPEVKKRKQK